MRSNRTIQIAFDIVKGAKFGAGMQLFELVTDALGNITKVAKDAGVESVKLAANFQQTANAVAVYTGSLSSAKAELSAIEKVAKDTTGLRLESAEKGFQQLRALGFEAKLARGFIKELGEEKILSGASDEALSRIAFNFSQIASGGQKVSQELREILNQMPSLRTAFFEAFGSLDPKKIQTFFDKDMDGAFQRLIDTMARGKQATGGLNDAVGKLQDEAILLGRAFGEPLLDPLTAEFKNVTKYLSENKDSFTEWGIFAKHELATVADFARKLGTAYEYARSAYNYSFWGDRPKSREQIEREAQERMGLDSRFNEVLNSNPNLLRADNTVDFSQPFGTRDEVFAQQLAAEQKRLQQVEKNRAQELTLLKLHGDESNSILKNQFEVENALRDLQLRYTTEQERDFISGSGQARAQQIQKEIAQKSAYYKQLFALNEGNDEELQKIAVERNKALSDLNTQFQINELKTLKEVAEAERRIFEERRQAAIQSKQLQISERTFGFDSQSFDVERQLSQGVASIEQGYTKLREIALSSNNDIRRLTGEQFQLQLQDQTLSAEQRLNVLRQMHFEQRRLTEESSRSILDIEQRQYQEQIKRIEFHSNNIISSYRNAGQFISEFQNLLYGERSSSGRTNTIFSSITGAGNSQLDAVRKQLAALNEFDEKLGSLTDRRVKGDKDAIGILETMARGAKDFYGDVDNYISKTISSNSVLRTGLNETVSDIEKAQKQLSPLFERISKIRQSFVSTPEGVDDLRDKFLRERQNTELAQINEQIRAKGRILSEGKGKISLLEEKQLTFDVLQLEQQRANLGVSFLNQQNDLYSESINGLKEYIKALREGDEQATAFAQNIAQR